MSDPIPRAEIFNDGTIVMVNYHVLYPSPTGAAFTAELRLAIKEIEDRCFKAGQASMRHVIGT
jgi:hypothetical protein